MRFAASFISSLSLVLVACAHSPEQYTLAEKQYIDRVLRKIEIIGEHRYPALTRGLDKPVELVVAFQISHGGSLQGVHILRPSDKPAIDNAMLELIRYSAPYPPMPDSIVKATLTIQKRWLFRPTN
jgi:TonB family protein